MPRLALYTFMLPFESYNWDTDEDFYNHIISLIINNCDEEYLKQLELDEEYDAWEKAILTRLQDGDRIVDVVDDVLTENYDYCSNVLQYQIEFNDVGNDYIVSHAVIYK